MIEFPCPHCSSRLRLQDRSLRGRTVDCPDCQQPLLIEDGPDGLRGTPVQKKVQKPAEQPGPDHKPSRRMDSRYVIWGSAGICFLAVVIWSLQSGPMPPGTGDTPTDVGSVPQQGNVIPEPPIEDPGAITAEARLQNLAQEIQDHVKKRGNFPEPTEKLSWLGQVQRLSPGIPAYHPDTGWDEEVNDAFVRRRVEEYLNPALQKLVGEDGYPATHFAGISGLGDDAASLPMDHPRAGIFGVNRFTTPDDVKDGLTNTMLVAGVTQRLGSWAAPGNPTLRSLTKEPYVNGPDGLGTGQVEGMHVLMADGSVRFLSAHTDPVILRRMAAMADGLPLDPNIAGDPLAMQPKAEPVNPVAAPGDPPIQVELAPEPPPFDVAKSLSQKLIRFDQTRPLTLKSLLIQWSEMAALPVDISQVPVEVLQQEQKHTLENIDLRVLMDHLTKPAGLTAIYDDNFGVRLQPR